MRTLLSFFLLVLAPSLLGAQSTALDAKSRADLLATRELAWRAWFSGDNKTLEAMLPAEFVGVGWGGGPWNSKAESIAASQEFAKNGGKLHTLDFPKTEIQVYGNTVLVYTTYVYETEIKGQRAISSGRATEMFVRRGDDLVNVGWHMDAGK